LLAKGARVDGYVTSACASGKGAGVYVALSSSQAARVQLRRLSDDYVDDPVATFPAGKHVCGRIVEVAGPRVELSLKTLESGDGGGGGGGGGAWRTLESLEVGETVTGRVRKVESFGVFIAIADSLLQGLAHVSELSDSFVKDPADRFQVGQAVRAVVLKKDEAKQQVSLGIKKSYFDDGGDGSASDMGADNADDIATGTVSGDRAKTRADRNDIDEDMDLEDAMAAAFDESDSDEGEGEGSDIGADGGPGDDALDSEDEATDAVLRAARREQAAAEAGADVDDADEGAAAAAGASSSSGEIEDEEGKDTDATAVPASAATALDRGGAAKRPHAQGPTSGGAADHGCAAPRACVLSLRCPRFATLCVTIARQTYS
jgi:predicted RNA-binding protein with RPS1 domain